MISSKKATEKILAAPAPVLFLDTCAILDTIRSPLRDGSRYDPGHVEAALHVIERAENGQIWIVCSSQIVTEFEEHKTPILETCVASLKKLEEQIARAERFLQAVGITMSTPTPSLTSSGYVDEVQKIADRLFSASIKITHPRNNSTKAMARVAGKIAPSNKGQQAKDCAIIEAYLHLALLLQQGGLKHNKVFLTTNIRDYCDYPQATLHPDLTADFLGAGLLLAVNFSHAESQL